MVHPDPPLHVPETHEDVEQSQSFVQLAPEAAVPGTEQFPEHWFVPPVSQRSPVVQSQSLVQAAPAAMVPEQEPDVHVWVLVLHVVPAVVQSLFWLHCPSAQLLLAVSQ